jgi:predicted MPP superfamily phosphohydrolase
MVQKMKFSASTYSSTRRWLWWQCGLNIALVLAVVVLRVLGIRRSLFLLALVPLAFLPFAYARLRLLAFLEQFLCAQLRVPRLFSFLVWFGAICDIVMVAQLLTARSEGTLPLLHSPGFSWVGAIWFSAHGLLFLAYTLLGFGRFSSRVLKRLLSPRSPVPSETLVSLERRQFLQQIGVLGAGVPFFISLSNVKLSYDFRVEERELSLPNWPRELDGLRVAHLSDIHVGGASAMNRERLFRMAALTAAARPDIVLHTGDFLTHRKGDFDLPLYEALGRIRAPYGQWACLGNHDFDDPQRLVRLLREAGVITLRNAVTTLYVQGHALELAGIDFVFARNGRQEHFARILHSWGTRESVPRLLLNHDPQAFALLPDGCAELVLSGHTHGGHVGVQLGRDRAITVVGLCGIPDQGLFHRDNMQMFVTRCVGFYGYPMRLGIPPEISLLTLRALHSQDPTRHKSVSNV